MNSFSKSENARHDCNVLNDDLADSNSSSDVDDESSDEDSFSSTSDEEDDSAGYSSASDSQMDFPKDDGYNPRQDPPTHSAADDDSSQDY